MTFPMLPMSLMSASPGGGLSMPSIPPYGLAMRFQVSVDGLDLGGWSSCTGLRVDLHVTKVMSGGDYSTEYILPDHVSYPNIKLERAVHQADSNMVKRWLELKVSQWMNYTGSGEPYAGGTGKITLLGAQGTEVMHWDLTGVYPVSWSGPSLGATENKVAIEALELAHQGFLNSGSTGSVK